MGTVGHNGSDRSAAATDSVWLHTPRDASVRGLHTRRTARGTLQPIPSRPAQKTRSRDTTDAPDVIDACAEGHMHLVNRLVICTATSLAFAGCALNDSSSTDPDETAGEAPSAGPAIAASAIQHVFVIAMENHATSRL